jgi:hypothetical protein
MHNRISNEKLSSETQSKHFKVYFASLIAGAFHTAYSKTEVYPETVSNITDIVNLFLNLK